MPPAVEKMEISLVHLVTAYVLHDLGTKYHTLLSGAVQKRPLVPTLSTE